MKSDAVSIMESRKLNTPLIIGIGVIGLVVGLGVIAAVDRPEDKFGAAWC